MGTETMEDATSAPPSSDPCAGSSLYVIHLYSGRRREHDFHAHLTSILAQQGSNLAAQIHIISIDTAISHDMNVHSEKL